MRVQVILTYDLSGDDPMKAWQELENDIESKHDHMIGYGDTGSYEYKFVTGNVFREVETENE